MPPVAPILAVPLQDALQLKLVLLVIVATKVAGSTTTSETLEIHPLASVTNIE